MLIIQVAGGLGNQMQQYAMYRKLKKTGKDVKLDLSWFEPQNQTNVSAKRECELKFFDNLPMEECTKKERDVFLNKSVFHKVLYKLFPDKNKIWSEKEMYHPEIYDMDNRYLQGFFLCNKYYEDILPEIRKDFVFPQNSDSDIARKNEYLMDEMRNSNSCSIHLRMGDYVTDPVNFKLFGNIATDKYYESAIQKALECSKDMHFYIFSNDSEYAKKKYSDENRFTIVDWNTGRNSIVDMLLMSCCKVNICANSTFSFWGARLNNREDKVCIRPYKMRNNQEVIEEKMHDYWKNWVLIDEEGQVR